MGQDHFRSREKHEKTEDLEDKYDLARNLRKMREQPRL